MKISIFQKVSSPYHGEIATSERFNQIADDPRTLAVIKEVRDLYFADKESGEKKNADKIGQLKKQLPIITWQASFVDGHRKESNAVPSGLFMIDIDHPEPKIADEIVRRAMGRISELGIVYIGYTPTDGVRVVADCTERHSNIAEAQSWLYEALEVPQECIDEHCTDWARASFMVASPLIRYMDYSIFEREPRHVFVNERFGGAESEQHKVQKRPAKANEQTEMFEGDLQRDYNGIPLKEIAVEWLKANGGEPKEGDRNTKLFKLAIRLRFICDFNENVLAHNLPDYGLSKAELRQIAHSACSFARTVEMPSDLEDILDKISFKKGLVEAADGEEFDPIDINDTSKTPKLPPIFKEWHAVAPEDFKIPSVIVQLPILGALGSRLRAKYLDGVLHSPSFQVSLEAPQASGKSFMTKICDYDLALMKEHDQEQRVKEREYNEKVKQLKLLNTKVTKKDKDSVLGEKPETLIRYVPPTMSITQLLIRMNNAKGLHLFATAPEIDTVLKAFKRGFSSFSDALRCSFDNSEYGQDYASENSFSGIVPLYYNVLFSGTPKAMRRFYPDVEDGLVSRVTFVTLPDQFGKPHPNWGKFDEKQKQVVDVALMRLNEISIQGDEVQPEHVMEMGWLAEDMKKWILAQQQEALRTNDRARDIFCRRAAVVGFRAGMLAWFLWDENKAGVVKHDVKLFARWIANLMLKQHLGRFNLGEQEKNEIPFYSLYKALPEVFDKAMLNKEIVAQGTKSPIRTIIYKWASLGLLVKGKKEKNGSYVKNVK